MQQENGRFSVENWVREFTSGRFRECGERMKNVESRFPGALSH